MVVDIKQGFAAVDSGLDKMNEGVAAVKEKIIELHCDVNHVSVLSGLPSAATNT